MAYITMPGPRFLAFGGSVLELLDCDSRSLAVALGLAHVPCACRCAARGVGPSRVGRSGPPRPGELARRAAGPVESVNKDLNPEYRRIKADRILPRLVNHACPLSPRTTNSSNRHGGEPHGPFTLPAASPNSPTTGNCFLDACGLRESAPAHHLNTRIGQSFHDAGLSRLHLSSFLRAADVCALKLYSNNCRRSFRGSNIRIARFSRSCVPATAMSDRSLACDNQQQCEGDGHEFGSRTNADEERQACP